MKQKKVLLVSSEFPPLPGGIGKHAFDLATSLSELNHQIVVLTNARTSKHIELTFDQEQPFRVVRVLRNRLLPWTYFMRFVALWNIMRSFHPNHVIFSGKFSIWMIPGVKRLFRTHNLAIVHGSELGLHGVAARWMTKGLQRADVVVAVSSFTAELAQKLYQHPRMVIIPNGLRLQEVKRPLAQETKLGEPMLITVGSISPRKGQHNVLRAMPSILSRFPKAHYHILGLDHHRAEVDKLIQDLTIGQYVTIHGSLPDADKDRLTAAADIFLMLSENQPNGDVEGFGIAILEANAWGVPAIGSTGCGIEDAISSLSGVLVNPKDNQAIVQAVTDLYDGRLITNPTAWSQQFQWKKLVLEYDKLLA